MVLGKPPEGYADGKPGILLEPARLPENPGAALVVSFHFRAWRPPWGAHTANWKENSTWPT